MNEFRPLETLSNDLRYAFRILTKSRGFTAITVLMLALGIGANTAVFSIVNEVLLRPLPYKDPDRLVNIWDKMKLEQNLSKIFASYRDFDEFQKHSRSFEHIAVATWATGGRTLTGRGPAKSVLAIPVSSDFFAILGVPSALGRTFQPDDLTRGCSVVLAHWFWKDIGGPGDIVGQGLTLDHQVCIVIGVMPAGFAFYPAQTGLWMLITPGFTPPPDQLLAGIFGKLKPGVNMASAQAEVTVLHERLHQHDAKERNVVPVIYDMKDEFTWLAGRNLRLSLIVLFVAVGFVLAIACVNVANLLLGRSLVRQRELAIRAALGSGRKRLMRQLLTEGLILASLGAGLGVLLAEFSVRYFRSVNPIELPPGRVVSVDVSVLAFTAVLVVLTTLLFGFMPAWRASRVDLNDVLKASGRGASQGLLRNRVAKGLVIGEVTLSLILLAGAGLLVDSVLRLGDAATGVWPANVVNMNITLPKDRYTKAPRQTRFFDALLNNSSSLPGVKGVAIQSRSALGITVLSTGGQPLPPGSARVDVESFVISPDYFRIVGVPLRRGRLFDTGDRSDSDQVALINEALVREYFPGEDPLRKHIRLGREEDKSPWLTVVGVVGNEKHTNVNQEMNWMEGPDVYRPYQQEAKSAATLMILTGGGDPLAVVPSVQRKVASLDSAVPVSGIETMDERASKFLAYPRFRAALLGIFAGLALLLAAVGLYGVIAQSVVQRTQEIGVRMALGAQKSDVLSLVLRQGMLLVVFGLSAGLLSALALGRYLSSLLYGVKPTDPLALGAVCLTLIAAAFLAIYIPARRAARVDPMVALRYE